MLESSPTGGLPLSTRDLMRTIGYMPQSIRLVPGLTVEEQVAYAGWLRGLSSSMARAEAGRRVEAVGLADKAHARASQLSGGQLRRVGLAAALMGDAKTLLLDEPTAGLDPAQVGRFRDLIAGLDPSLTVVVSTHDVADLDEVYDRVVVLHDGRIAFDGSPSEFLSCARPGDRHQAESAYRVIVEGGF